MKCLVIVGAVAVLGACASRTAILDVSGSIMYEKPAITEVSHTLTDERDGGGTAAVTVRMTGDPGLVASFDISPGVANREPMTEKDDGNYVGEFVFAPDDVGGPYTVIGRLRHEEAGEVILRDPRPIILALPERPR